MTDTGVFKYVWRFNAIVIALAAVAVLGVAVVGMLELASQLFRDRSVTDVVNVEPSTGRRSAELRYGAPIWAGPDRRLVLPVEVAQSYGSGSSSKASGGLLANYMRQTDEGSFAPVFEGMDRLILSRHLLRVPVPGQDDTRVVGVLVALIDTDSNGDGRLTRRDRRTILLLSPSFGSPKILFEGLTGQHWPTHREGLEFDMVLLRDTDVDLVRFSAEDGATVSVTALPSLDG